MITVSVFCVVAIIAAIFTRFTRAYNRAYSYFVIFASGYMESLEDEETIDVSADDLRDLGDTHVFPVALHSTQKLEDRGMMERELRNMLSPNL